KASTTAKGFLRAKVLLPSKQNRNRKRSSGRPKCERGRLTTGSTSRPGSMSMTGREGTARRKAWPMKRVGAHRSCSQRRRGRQGGRRQVAGKSSSAHDQ